jgi:hypothetical protein
MQIGGDMRMSSAKVGCESSSCCRQLFGDDKGVKSVTQINNSLPPPCVFAGVEDVA